MDARLVRYSSRSSFVFFLKVRRLWFLIY